MQMFVSSSVLHAFCILLNQGASVCRLIFNACVKTMRDFTHTSHSYKHTHAHTRFPSTLSLKKKKKNLNKN